MVDTTEAEATALATAVRSLLTQRHLAAVNSEELFAELRRDPDAYGFTTELQQLSVYQIFDRLNRACRLGVLARRRQAGGPVWWSKGESGSEEALLRPWQVDIPSVRPDRSLHLSSNDKFLRMEPYGEAWSEHRPIDLQFDRQSVARLRDALTEWLRHARRLENSRPGRHLTRHEDADS